MSNTAQLLALLLIVVMLAGCDQQQVRTYRVQKDQMRTVAEPVGPRHAPIIWQQPPDWQTAPSSPVRFASFVVTGPESQRAEISVVPLSGHAGSDLDNFNRWRAQLGLPPAEHSELEKSSTQIEIGGQQGKLIEIAGISSNGSRGSRIIVAVVQRGGTTWFFKMMGDDALVAAQKKVFMDFLGSIKYAD